MSEVIIPVVDPVVEPITPKVEPITQPQAVNVDIQAILKQAEEKANQVAETKADAVMKSMLKQQGLDDENIKTMLAEWKSNQVTPEQTIQELQTKLELANKKETELTQREIALLKGVPLNSQEETEKEKVNACLTLAKSYVSETVTFETALDKALNVISFENQTKKEVKEPYAGAGRKSLNTVLTTEKEKALEEIKKKMKIK